MGAELIAVLYRHGSDDYGLWELDLPESAIEEIEAILDRYRDRGCSVRGNKNDIKEEL